MKDWRYTRVTSFIHLFIHTFIHSFVVEKIYPWIEILFYHHLYTDLQLLIHSVFTHEVNIMEITNQPIDQSLIFTILTKLCTDQTRKVTSKRFQSYYFYKQHKHWKITHSYEETVYVWIGHPTGIAKRVRGWFLRLRFRFLIGSREPYWYGERWV
jgi:hypothetical protein